MLDICGKIFQSIKNIHTKKKCNIALMLSKMTKQILIICLLSINITVMAQSRASEVKINDIKAQLENENLNYTYQPGLSKKQNDLLLKKHKAKIKNELLLLESRDIILEGELFDNVNNVFEKLLAANSSIPQNTKLVIRRSTTFNAFTIGDDVVFVFVGLIYKLKNDAEIALVLAHEIAHNTLNHVENSMIASVLLETNDTLLQKINTIIKTEYKTSSALNKLLAPRLLESLEESRNHEFSADSLGLIYCEKAQFNVQQTLSMFQAMESETKNLNPTIDLHRCIKFNDLPEIVLKEKAYKRESSLGAFEKEELNPYLLTHPYDRERFLRLAIQSKSDTVFNNYISREDSLFIKNHKYIGHEMMLSAVKNKNLTDAFYYACRNLMEYPKDEKTYRMLQSTLLSLGFLKERRQAGKYLMLQNPNRPEDKDRLCAFMYALSPTDCKTLAQVASKNSGEINSKDKTDVEGAIIRLFECIEDEDYDAFMKQWRVSKKAIDNSSFNWILAEMETYLERSKQLKFKS